MFLLNGGYSFGDAFERLSCSSEDSMIESEVDKRIRDVLIHLDRCCSLPCRRLMGSPGSERNADERAFQPKSSTPPPLS